MNIHEVLIYTFAGIEVATYPKARQLQLVSSWLTANRLFSVTNNFTDNQQIINMKLKFSFLHSSQNELSFVIITDRADPTITIMTFLRHVRDEFTVIIPEKVDFNRHDENLYDFTSKLKGIVDDMIGRNNAEKNRRKMHVVS